MFERHEPHLHHRERAPADERLVQHPPQRLGRLHAPTRRERAKTLGLCSFEDQARFPFHLTVSRHAFDRALSSAIAFLCVSGVFQVSGLIAPSARMMRNTAVHIGS